MGRLLTFLLGLLILGAVAYRYPQGGWPRLGGNDEAPQERLENVQRKADEIERDLQDRAKRRARKNPVRDLDFLRA